MTGRRPTPAYLKEVQGTGRPSRANPVPPAVTPGRPRIPRHLSPGARAAWRVFAPILDRMGVLTNVDGMALERACECYADIRELQATITREGRTYETRTERGDIMHRARPEVAALADADRRLKAWLVEFGLTPAARSRVQATPPTPKGSADARYFG